MSTANDNHSHVYYDQFGEVTCWAAENGTVYAPPAPAHIIEQNPPPKHFMTAEERAVVEAVNRNLKDSADENADRGADLVAAALVFGLLFIASLLVIFGATDVTR